MELSRAMSEAPLMPKATAVWLVENTSLTFDQIAEFCKLHPLEVKGIADGEVATGIKGYDPISTGQLTREAIAKAEKNPSPNCNWPNRRCERLNSKKCAAPATRPPGVLQVDIVGDEVEQQADPVGVGRVSEGLQLREGPEARIGLVGRGEPIAVIPGISMTIGA